MPGSSWPSACPASTTSPSGVTLGESPIRLVGVRHEQTAAYAADGYARASGKLGVAVGGIGGRLLVAHADEWDAGHFYKPAC